ncbi:MAG: transposase [Paracoccaceae bacterium]
MGMRTRSWKISFSATFRHILQRKPEKAGQYCNICQEMKKGHTRCFSNLICRSQGQHRCLVDEVFELMKQTRFVGLKKSLMGKALAYALTLEDGLRLFLNDGLLEVSNNSIENIIRHVAIVQKKTLFAGSEAGGENWAIAQSIYCDLQAQRPQSRGILEVGIRPNGSEATTLSIS